jgi:hypothetical protein
VIVDGIAAARQSGHGRVIFVNGYVLSYPTNRDVALDITADGTVPENPGPDLVVLSVRELDNRGAAVPGSLIRITEPVAAAAVPLSPAPEPTPVPSAAAGTPVSSTPTNAGGSGWVAGLLAAGALIIFRVFRYGKR